MKLLLALTLLAVALAFTTSTKWDSVLNGDAPASDEEILAMYKDWLIHYEKDTSDLSDTMERFTIFKEKTREIMGFNADKSNTWTKGLNQFSDLTDDEFYGSERPLMADQECSATNRQSWSLGNDENLPKFVDWREHGVVSEVKDQGSCGSCWTFSTTGTFESHWGIAHEGRDHTQFSEQQLVDCAGDFDNDGCRGGLPSHAFTYIYYNGLETEDQYAYTATDETCKYVSGITKGADLGSFNVTVGDEYSMK